MSAVRRNLPALVSTFEEIYAETGDAESHGIATLLVKYKTVACIYMLSEVFHIVAKLQGSLQARILILRVCHQWLLVLLNGCWSSKKMYPKCHRSY